VQGSDGEQTGIGEFKPVTGLHCAKRGFEKREKMATRSAAVDRCEVLVRTRPVQVRRIRF
jgi:hypothetical protein